MGDHRFGGAQYEPRGHVRIHVGQFNRDDFGAEIVQNLYPRQHRRGDFGVDVFAHVLLVQPDAQTFDSPVYSGAHSAYRVRQGSGIVGVEAGDGLQHDAGIGGAARQGSDVVQRCGQIQHPVAADSAPCGLEPHSAAGGGGKADRTAGIAAQGPEAQPRGRGHARAAGRRARPAPGIPGIEGNFKVGMVAAHGAFRQVELAQQHGPGRRQPRHDGGVEVGHVVGQHPGAPHGANASGAAQIFDGDGNPMQRPPIGARAYFFFRAARRRPRLFGQQRGVAFQAAVQLRDALQHLFGQLHGRNLPRLEQCGNLGDGLVVEGHLRPCLSPRREPGTSPSSR